MIYNLDISTLKPTFNGPGAVNTAIFPSPSNLIYVQNQFLNDDLNFHAMQNAEKFAQGDVSSNKSDCTFISFLGRAVYLCNSMYIATISLRSVSSYTLKIC